ncbi:hypothetical protein AB0L82_43105 [Nocardia sp. NPDC052001]|uniref:hypothetical protein n=1 Tax=Nocardia sp. NPDC052001 TaxID=3154853 RepID=UPI003416DC25
MTAFDVRPAGPALDLTAEHFAELTAEIRRLSTDLACAQLALDDLSDETSPINLPYMERLTMAAMLDRGHRPRARRVVSAGTATHRAGVLARLAHSLRHRSAVGA